MSILFSMRIEGQHAAYLIIVGLKPYIVHYLTDPRYVIVIEDDQTRNALKFTYETDKQVTISHLI